jgi:hypothetical protein
MKTILATTALIGAMGLGHEVSAQDLTYLSYGGSYLSLNADGGELEFTELYVKGEYDTGRFLLLGALSAAHVDLGIVSADATQLDLLAGYRIEPNLILLAGIDVSHSDFGGTNTGYSLGMEYDRNAMTVGFHVDGDEDELDQTSLYAGYRLSEATEVSLELTRQDGSGGASTGYALLLDHSLGPLDLNAFWLGSDSSDYKAVAANATYEFGNRFRLIGGAAFSGSGSSNAIIYMAGGGYRIADNVWLDASYTAVDDSGGSSLDAITLGLTFERGRHSLLRSRMEDVRENSGALLIF